MTDVPTDPVAQALHPVGEFRPGAFYHAELDFMLVLLEDCSYRADWHNPNISVLLHPYEDRIIGVKIEQWSVLSQQEAPRISPSPRGQKDD